LASAVLDRKADPVEKIVELVEICPKVDVGKFGWGESGSIY